MAEFRINYEVVIAQAEQIYDLSDDLNREIAKLEELLSSVRSSWQGPASEAYQNQLLALITDMKTTKYNMSRVSSTIKTVANKIQNEDERLAEIANSSPDL